MHTNGQENLNFLLPDVDPPSNTVIHQPTTLTTPNGIQIQSAVFLQLTHRTDRLSDGLGNKPVRIPTYNLICFS